MRSIRHHLTFDVERCDRVIVDEKFRFARWDITRIPIKSPNEDRLSVRKAKDINHLQFLAYCRFHISFPALLPEFPHLRAISPRAFDDEP